MKALVYMGPHDLKILYRDEPNPKAHEVKLRPRLVGICGSDIHGYTGSSGRRIAPMVMGHEIAAVVDSVGDGVTKFKAGDRVTVQPIMYCGNCDYCKVGLTNVCANRRGLGVLNVDGAFSEYFCINENNVFAIPDNVSDKAAAMMDPFSVVFRALKYAMPLQGKNLLIIGAGTIGILALKLARYFRAEKIIVSDLSSERLAIAKGKGADFTVNPKCDDISVFLAEKGLKDKIDVAMECVGASPTARQSIDNVRINGLAIWIGNAARMIEIDMQSIVTRSICVQGTYGFTETDFIEALDFLSTSGIDIDDIATRVISLEQAPETFESLCSGAGTDLKVLVRISCKD